MGVVVRWYTVQRKAFEGENFRGLLRSNYYVGVATKFCGGNFHGWF